MNHIWHLKIFSNKLYDSIALVLTELELYTADNYLGPQLSYFILQFLMILKCCCESIIRKYLKIFFKGTWNDKFVLIF